MPTPAGVTTVTVNLVPPLGVPASAVWAKAVPSVDLKWSATDTPLSEMISASSGLGLILPAPDQAGFVTRAGSPFSGWEYLISLEGRVQGRSFSETYLLKLSRTQTSVDLPILQSAIAPTAPTGAAGLPVKQTITYDTNGNVQSVTEDGVTTLYTYNSDGTVATDTRAGIARRYTYDASGNLTKIEAQ